MQRKRIMAAVGAAAVLATGLTACGGSGSNGSGGAGQFNAAVGKVFNPSDAKGGVVRMANSGDWDSLDPADSYYSREKSHS